MSHRLDIELTSSSDSGWTWRAAGARQPKGIVDVSLLYPGAQVGDVVRAEAERDLDGTRIVSIVAPRAAKTEAERIQLIERAAGPAVSVSYAEKAGGRDRDGERRGPRPARTDRPDGGRGERPNRPGADRGAPGSTRGPRPERGERPPRTDRPARTERPATRPDRPGRVGARPQQKRFAPGKAHRDALLDTLPVEQRPVAEQLFRGGIPAVRQAIIDQNAQLKAAGQNEVPAGPLLAMAEDLLPKTRQAEWLDRAAAALDVADDISLRDLRAVVTQADGVAKDDASRDMSAKLRDALNRRVEGERTAWVNDITASLDDAKLVRAVRLSGRLPDPGAKLPPEVLARLIGDTNAGLAADTPQDRWAALIEAAADAPFRRDVSPAGLPTNANESVLATAAQASNRIPSLLKLLGLTIPPPPRAKAAVGTRPLPPPPPRMETSVEAPAVDAAPTETPVAETPVATPVDASPIDAPSSSEAPTADAVAADATTVVEATPVVEAPATEPPAIEVAATEVAAVAEATQIVDAEIPTAVDAE